MAGLSLLPPTHIEAVPSPWQGSVTVTTATTARVVARVPIAIVKLNTSRQIGSRYIAAPGIVAIISIVHAWVVAGRTSSSSPSSTPIVPRTAGTQPTEPTARIVPRAGGELHGRHRDGLDGGKGGAVGTRKDLQVVGGLKRWLGVHLY